MSDIDNLIDRARNMVAGVVDTRLYHRLADEIDDLRTCLAQAEADRTRADNEREINFQTYDKHLASLRAELAQAEAREAEDRKGFEIVRTASRLFEQAANDWQNRALKAEAALSTAQAEAVAMREANTKIAVEAIENTARFKGAAELALMVLCSTRDAQSWSANMLKDFDCAIEATRAALKRLSKDQVHRPTPSWYCDQCHVEVYDRRCPHCGKTEQEKSATALQVHRPHGEESK